MCTLVGKIDDESFTGYKIIYRDENDRMLSPAIGIEYKEGMELPKIQSVDKGYSRIFEGSAWSEPNTILINHYKAEMQGRTSVIVDIEDARKLLSVSNYDNMEVIKGQEIVKMTIEKDLMNGYFGSKNNPIRVVAGRKITKIEVVETY